MLSPFIHSMNPPPPSEALDLATPAGRTQVLVVRSSNGYQKEATIVLEWMYRRLNGRRYFDPVA